MPNPDIPLNQGAVKLSEVATDRAQTIANIPANQDALSAYESLQSVVGDLLSRVSLFLTSQQGYPSTAGPGSVVWSGTNITFSSATSIVVKIIQASSGIATDLVLLYGASNGTTAFNTISIPNGQILYIELDRSNLTGSNLILENAAGGGSINPGKTVKVASSLPTAINTSGSNGQGTMAIPLAINIAGSILWIPHGIFWPINTSSPLGAVITTTSLPIGSITPYTTFGNPSPYGYSTAKVSSPGFALCDGSVIIDPTAQTLRNPTRNDDGTPSVSYNPALDKFTPNLNGPPPAWNSSLTWNENDYVINGTTHYVASTPVPTGIAITSVQQQDTITVTNALGSHTYTGTLSGTNLLGATTTDNWTYTSTAAVAQVDRITVPYALNSYTYTGTINNITWYRHTLPSGNTASSIATGIASSINGLSGAGVTAYVPFLQPTTVLITSTTPGWAGQFTDTVGPNLSLTTNYTPAAPSPTTIAAGIASAINTSFAARFTASSVGGVATVTGLSTYWLGKGFNDTTTDSNLSIANVIPAKVYWIPESLYNNTSASNVYNKYRRSTTNQTSGSYNNTYLRGSSQSYDANNAGAYGGANTHLLALEEMPVHDHGGTTSTHSHYLASNYFPNNLAIWKDGIVAPSLTPGWAAGITSALSGTPRATTQEANGLTINPARYCGPAITMSSISQTGYTITVTTSSNHNVLVGDLVTLSGFVSPNTALNGTWTVATQNGTTGCTLTSTTSTTISSFNPGSTPKFQGTAVTKAHNNEPAYFKAIYIVRIY